MKLITWNVAGRTRDLAARRRRWRDRSPISSACRRSGRRPCGHFAATLADDGLAHALDSSRVRNERRLFNLTVSRWPANELPAVGAPFPERVLSTAVGHPVRNARAPPRAHPLGPQPRDQRRSKPARRSTSASLGRPSTTASSAVTSICRAPRRPRARSSRSPVTIPRCSSAGTPGERSILPGLAEWDLRDVFRELNGFERQDASWVLHTRARRKAGLRLDHILASAGLRPRWCDYHHGWREDGLSDHSALEAIFDPAQAAAGLRSS